MYNSLVSIHDIVCVRAKTFQVCLTLCDPVDVAHQAPLSMGFSRQEYRSGLSCPPPGDLPDPGIEPVSLTSPALAGGFFTTKATWEARLECMPIPKAMCGLNQSCRGPPPRSPQRDNSHFPSSFTKTNAMSPPRNQTFTSPWK